MTSIAGPPQDASEHELEMYYRDFLDMPLDVVSGPQIRIDAAKWLREYGYINKEEADQIIKDAQTYLDCT